VIAKGPDRIEPMLRHLARLAPPDFGFGFNLGYGGPQPDRRPVRGVLRALVDEATRTRRATGP
jgi:hypothetical protein